MLVSGCPPIGHFGTPFASPLAGLLSGLMSMFWRAKCTQKPGFSRQSRAGTHASLATQRNAIADVGGRWDAWLDRACGIAFAIAD